MKFVKWLLGTVIAVFVLIGGGAAALVYLVDWNDYKETIQNQVKNQTGRDLLIAGDLSPSVFPWAGISIGEISLANADGYGDQPFASIGSADVKVKLLPLIRKEVSVRTVQLHGLRLDLQRNAEGATNWDDLITTTTTTSTTEAASDDAEVTTEVEGSSATIAALAVGGVEISDANVSWNDALTGTDAQLSSFDLTTGLIELEKPFDLNVDFAFVSNSMDLAADVKGSGELMIDLEEQTYTINGFTLDANANGSALPVEELAVQLGADVVARLGENAIDVPALSLSTLGVELNGQATVSALDTEPVLQGQLSSNDFSPRQIMEALGIEDLVTADADVLKKANLSLSLNASPVSASLDDLTITLDDTTINGNASVPSLDAAVPPVRFDLAVDAIDVDRYLPPPVDTPAEEQTEAAPAQAATTTGDEPIELPVDMIRLLDVDGVIRIGSVKVSNLTTTDIAIPIKAAAGKLGVESVSAQLYEGKLDASASLDVSEETPGYSVAMTLNGIQAEPLLADLTQKDAFLSGKGEVVATMTSLGSSVNAIKSAINGKFNAAFIDGSVNGINVGYQLRRAQAMLSGKEVPAAATVKTDFSSLTMSGTLTEGVLSSDDLDLRSPLLRIGGMGTVDLPAENVDYTLTTLVTGTTQGQGGAELDSLKGVKLDIPIRGSFEELANDFAGVMLSGMRDNIAGNLKSQAQAIADQKAEALKAEAREKAEAVEAQAKEAAKAKEEELKQQAEEIKDEALDQAKDKLRGLFK